MAGPDGSLGARACSRPTASPVIGAATAADHRTAPQPGHGQHDNATPMPAPSCSVRSGIGRMAAGSDGRSDGAPAAPGPNDAASNSHASPVPLIRAPHDWSAGPSTGSPRCRAPRRPGTAAGRTASRPAPRPGGPASRRQAAAPATGSAGQHHRGRARAGQRHAHRAALLDPSGQVVGHPFDDAGQRRTGDRRHPPGVAEPGQLGAGQLRVLAGPRRLGRGRETRRDTTARPPPPGTRPPAGAPASSSAPISRTAVSRSASRRRSARARSEPRTRYDAVAATTPRRSTEGQPADDPGHGRRRDRHDRGHHVPARDGQRPLRARHRSPPVLARPATQPAADSPTRAGRAAGPARAPAS